jgi:hypothetical protein
VAVQLQFAAVLILVVRVPPAMQMLRSTGATEYWHPPVSPACVTVNVRSATVILAVRSAISRFRDTAYATFPLPAPVPPDVTDNHDALLLAAHEHPAGASIVNVPVAASLVSNRAPAGVSS